MKTLLQLGHSRDGGRYYLAAARQRGWRCVLIETDTGKRSIEWGDRITAESYDDIVLAAPDADLVDLAAELEEDIVQVVTGFELFRLDAARVARRLGVTTSDDPLVLSRMRFKSAQRQFLADTAPQITQPDFRVCRDTASAIEAASEIGYPVVVKPDDSGGSAGVRLVRDERELRAAVAEMADAILDDGRRANGIFLVEDVVLGPEFGVQGVVDVHGRACVVSISNKVLDTSVGRFLERRHELAPPAQFPTVCAFAVATVHSLGLLGSAFHMDLRVRDGHPVLIEAGARLSGAYIPFALSAAGVDWAELSLDAALGEAITREVGLQRPATVELLTGDSFRTPGLIELRSSGDSIVLIDLERASRGGGYTHFGDRIGVRITIGT